MHSQEPPSTGTRSWSLKQVLGWTAVGLVGLLVIGQVFGEDESPSPNPTGARPAATIRASTPTPPPARPSWSGASVSGTGQSVKTIRLVEGNLVCEASVSGNDVRLSDGSWFGGVHFSVWIKGDGGSHLLVNDTAKSGKWSGVVRVRDAGSYLVEVDAEQRASWEVACVQP